MPQTRSVRSAPPSTKSPERNTMKIKKRIAAVVAAVAIGVSLAPTAQAAPPPPTVSTHAITGVRLSVVSDRWGLYHGKAVNLQSGGTVYYGPARWFKSDAWKDVQGWAN